MYSLTKHRIHVLVKIDKNLEKDVFRLITSVGRRKNSEFPWGIEPQTFGFRAPILSLISIHKHDSIDIADPSSMHSLKSLCGSVVEHRSADLRGIRRSEVPFLMGTQDFFSSSNDYENMQNIFLYFFIELKTYHLSYSIGKTCWKIATGNNRVYLHVTFGGIFTIQQGLISCPLHGKTALKISNITLWNS